MLSCGLQTSILRRSSVSFILARISTSGIDFVNHQPIQQFDGICIFGRSQLTRNAITTDTKTSRIGYDNMDPTNAGNIDTNIGASVSPQNVKRKQQWQNKKRPNNFRRSEYKDSKHRVGMDYDNDDNNDEDGIEGNRSKKGDRRESNHVAWNESMTPNLGSFARIEMQSLFNVKLPAAVAEATTQSSTPPTSRSAISAKRKVIMFLGYVGTNYGGFQMNERQRTIQAELELALYRLNLISSSNFGFPTKYGWSTSGRTDKGVHACAQVISSKIEIPLAKYSTKSRNEQVTDDKQKDDEHAAIDLDKVRDDLNGLLPHDLQIFDIVRTTRSFCAKTARDRVRYQYMIPSFLLMEPHKVRQIFESIRPNPNTTLTNQNSTAENDLLDLSTMSSLSPSEITIAQKELYSYRVSPEQLVTLQQSLSSYIGTHSFHNFSRRVKADEARASRYIVSFDVETPIQFGSNADSCIEWIPTNVVGQSFLLNQIRKMICLAVDVTRGVVSTTSNEEMKIKPTLLIEQALHREVDIRMSQAPAQGLFLEMSYYDGYNRKIKQSNPDLPQLNWATNAATASNNVNTSVPIDDSQGHNAAVAKRWYDFRHNVIMKHIDNEERNQGNFVSYLYVQECIFDYNNYYGVSDGSLKR